MGFTDENSSFGFDVRISKTFAQLLDINEKDVNFCDTKTSSNFDVNIPNTPDLLTGKPNGKEKLSLDGKSSSLGTHDDLLWISITQKQTEDEMSFGDKSSSSGVDVISKRF